jgi:hypothetical protein
MTTNPLSLNSVALALSAFALAAAIPCFADDGTLSSATNSASCPVVGYFENWSTRTTEIQSEQPHWVTPLVTVTPRLEQELRYDQSWERLPGGHTLDIDGGKGVELIPFDPVEVIIGIPAYESENTKPNKTGWADETFLIKYRILSANEKNGDYILTAFMGLSVPNGSAAFSSYHYAYTPTIAFGKGWGDFDIQSTLGVTIPDNGSAPKGPGTPIVFNTALQYRVDKYFWPELEANYTHWPNGKHEGLNQLLLTPGVVVGRFPIYHRVGLTLGFGCQFATTDSAQVRRNFIFSARLPF